MGVLTREGLESLVKMLTDARNELVTEVSDLRAKLAGAERERDEAITSRDAMARSFGKWIKERPVAPHPTDQMNNLERFLWEDTKAEIQEWKQRYTEAKGLAAQLSDKYNGEPCAEIRWQQEREDLHARIAAVERERDEVIATDTRAGMVLMLMDREATIAALTEERDEAIQQRDREHETVVHYEMLHDKDELRVAASAAEASRVTEWLARRSAEGDRDVAKAVAETLRATIAAQSAALAKAREALEEAKAVIEHPYVAYGARAASVHSPRELLIKIQDAIEQLDASALNPGETHD